MHSPCCSTVADSRARCELHVRVAAIEVQTRAFYSLVQQLLWGGLGVVSVAFAVLFDGRGQPRALLAAQVLCRIHI